MYLWKDKAEDWDQYSTGYLPGPGALGACLELLLTSSNTSRTAAPQGSSSGSIPPPGTIHWSGCRLLLTSNTCEHTAHRQDEGSAASVDSTLLLPPPPRGLNSTNAAACTDTHRSHTPASAVSEQHNKLPAERVGRPVTRRALSWRPLVRGCLIYWQGRCRMQHITDNWSWIQQPARLTVTPASSPVCIQ